MLFTNPPYICCFGEILWDILPAGKQIGGAPMNVAAHLQQLGLPSVMISRVGDDDLGNEIKAWMKSKGFISDFIQTDKIYATGIVNADVSDKNHVTYEIVEPAAWDFIEDDDEIQGLVENSYALVFGTLACRNEESRKCLFRLLEKAPLKIFDVNLRAPHYSQELVESMLHRADIVKMNEDELQLIAGWHGIDEKNERKQISDLMGAFNIPTLLVTCGANGAILSDAVNFYECEGFKVKVADTIGSGDSFLAGFLKKYLEGKPWQEALTHACALGALVATHHGAIPFVTGEEILNLIDRKGK